MRKWIFCLSVCLIYATSAEAQRLVNGTFASWGVYMPQLISIAGEPVSSEISSSEGKSLRCGFIETLLPLRDVEPTPKPEPEPTPEPEPVYVTDVELNLTSATLEVGESLRLVATVRPAYADDPSVRWSSSDAAIASVDERGLVQALRPGSATITVTTNDGGLTATCALTVNEIPTAIEDVEAKPVIYPTIVRDKFHVNVSEPQAVYLIDINGRVLRVIQVRAGETTVWMNGVGTGVYLVRLDGRTVRIIKE